jgi:hypothetical protein
MSLLLRSFVLTIALAFTLGLVGCGPAATVTAVPVAHASDGPPAEVRSGPYLSHLPKEVVVPQDDLGKLILREYGSLLVAGNGAIPPWKLVFRDEADVAAFQASVETTSHNFSGTTIELQAVAMRALEEAAEDGKRAGLSITPRGTRAGRRHYDLTAKLWSERVNAGMNHWVAAGKVSAAEARRIEALSPFDQVPEILRLEAKKLFFAKGLDKSILFSAAPPGASQHLSMLAVDIVQNADQHVRAVMAKHGWFQTVISDLPHFTYLGVTEGELPNLGLKSVRSENRTFWVPDLPN